MNILRTIQAKEKQEWVDLLFSNKQHDGNSPNYPPRLPFPKMPKQCKEGEFIYLIYKGFLIGYAIIDKIQCHKGVVVGTEKQLVKAGGEIITKTAFMEMPHKIPCRGFQGMRYTNFNLHELSYDEAKEELSRLKLF
ncbi:hypothetical protein ACPV3S_15990 [Photobacterium damselae]|uniref:hypothetical protein n=1 Tax=Photobacterium damselae TaxID=38293 RepID=UPI0040692695